MYTYTPKRSILDSELRAHTLADVPSIIDRIATFIVAPERYAWNLFTGKLAKAILRKIACCHKAGKYVPAEVNEAHIGSKLNVSFEGIPVRLGRDGVEVYLIQRPSLAENSSEPFPEMWHSPGVTRLVNEPRSTALQRLIKTEFGGIEPRQVLFLEFVEGQDPPRCLYEQQLHLLIMGATEPKNSRGRWVNEDLVPWEPVLESQRKFILQAIKKFKTTRYVQRSVSD